MAFVRIDGTPADAQDTTDATSSGISNFSSTVTFPTSGPVFDLPPGYTVNSPSAGIVNNQYVLPEPSALALLAAGSSGLALLGRRRARVGRQA